MPLMLIVIALIMCLRLVYMSTLIGSHKQFSGFLYLDKEIHKEITSGEEHTSLLFSSWCCCRTNQRLYCLMPAVHAGYKLLQSELPGMVQSRISTAYRQ